MIQQPKLHTKLRIENVSKFIWKGQYTGLVEITINTAESPAVRNK